jgi:transposase InsO family protein
VAGSIRSGRVIEVLSQLVSLHGAPRYLRSDNGPEFVSRAILKWAAQNGMDMALSDPGKPWQNGADESFNGKFRDECLSLEWFRTRTEAPCKDLQKKIPLRLPPLRFTDRRGSRESEGGAPRISLRRDSQPSNAIPSAVDIHGRLIRI